MKKLRVFLAVVAVGLLGLGVSGCRDEDKDETGTSTQAEGKAGTAKSAAQQKPKDHPAH